MVQQEAKRTRRKTTYKNADKKETADLLPQNDRQKEYIEAIETHSQIIVLGPAGTGKTT